MEAKHVYSIPDFLNLDESSLISNLVEHLKKSCYIKKVSQAQIKAWQNTLITLREIFAKDNPNWQIIFEYPLPLSSGKRPDLLLLNGKTIYVIEIKNKKSYNSSDCDQLNHYVSDLFHYHSVASQYKLEPILFLLGTDSVVKKSEHMTVLGTKELKKYLLSKYEAFLAIDLKGFVNAAFKPAPSIEEFAKNISRGDAYTVKGIENVSYKQSELFLSSLFEDAKANEKRIVALLQGEAGTGKTALGLKLARQADGLFLCKNKQLIDYLQESLGHKINFHTMHAFISEYGRSDKKPHRNVFIFDEAQRFWVKTKPKEIYGLEESEQEIVLRILSRLEWCFAVFMIGEGQQLTWDELSFTDPWEQAITKYSRDISFHVPKGFLSKKIYDVLEDTQLSLTNSMRTHKSPYYPTLINHLLGFSYFNTSYIIYLQNLIKSLEADGFHFRITRNLDQALEYCHERFASESNSYCLLSSTHSDYSSNELKMDFRANKKLRLMNHFNENGSLQNVETRVALNEFNIQGLEVKIPIVAWPEGFYWDYGAWKYTMEKSILGGTFYKLNALRVLLTRGRNGCIIYLLLKWTFNSTYQLFKELGVKEI